MGLTPQCLRTRHRWAYAVGYRRCVRCGRIQVKRWGLWRAVRGEIV